jgi:hypothetical protein
MSWFCSEVCAISKVLCLVSDGHYTEFGNSLVSYEEKGRRAHATRDSYLRRRETRPRNGRLVSEEKGDAPTQHTSRISGTRVSFLLNMHKKDCQQNILHGMLLAPARYRARCYRYVTYL